MKIPKIGENLLIINLVFRQLSIACKVVKIFLYIDKHNYFKRDQVLESTIRHFRKKLKALLSTSIEVLGPPTTEIWR